MTTTYPAKLMPVGDLYAADVDILNDPSAFAAELYNALAGDALTTVLPRESRTAEAALDAARDLVRETAAAGGDPSTSSGEALDDALSYVSDAAYGMANCANSRGMELGIAFECFRQALIGALTPRQGDEANNRSNLETVERHRAALHNTAAGQATNCHRKGVGTP